MKHKSKILENFKIWKAEVENYVARKKIKYLRMDNGREYKSTKFE